MRDEDHVFDLIASMAMVVGGGGEGMGMRKEAVRSGKGRSEPRRVDRAHQPGIGIAHLSSQYAHSFVHCVVVMRPQSESKVEDVVLRAGEGVNAQSSS